MDFLDRLQDKVNEIPQLPIELKQGYLDSGESFAIYPIPGSRTVTEYMDGVKEQALNLEIAMQSKSYKKIHDTLWMVQSKLENLDELVSHDGSFEFEDLTITNKPFINHLDDQGWFVFLLDIQVNITVFKEDE